MNSNYEILFGIDLLHEYYLNRECTDFEIVPTQDCKELAKRLNLQFRKKPSGLLAFLLTNDGGEPYINVPPQKNFSQYFSKSVFRFYLKLNNFDFLNYTNTIAAFGSKRKYYFSNFSRNEGLYLTTPVPDYTPGKTYLPGNLAKDPSTGEVYEAIKKHTPKKKAFAYDPVFWVPKGLLHSSNSVAEFSTGKKYTPGDLVKHPENGEVYEAVRKQTAGNKDQLDDIALWISKGLAQLQYPTENDLVEYSNGSYQFNLPAEVSKAEISVFGFNFSADNPAFDNPVLSESYKPESPTTKIPVRLSPLPPGRYEIHINKEVRNIYYDPFLNDSNSYAVIEIFNHLPASDPYALLTEEEKLTQVRYQVHFPNRRVLWKYIRKDGRADKITDTAENGYEFDLHGDDFVSTTPIPLTENTLKTLKLEFGSKDFRLFPLPNPPVDRLARYHQDDYDYLCSEVLLNY